LEVVRGEEMRDELTPIEVAILEVLEEGSERAAGVAKKTGLNSKSVWQALQRLKARGLVACDEKFGIYSITEEGRRRLEDIRKSDFLKNYVEMELLLMRYIDLTRKRLLEPKELEKMRKFFEELQSKRV